jgi:hypothetical protein
MATGSAQAATLFLVLPLAALSCAGAPVRRLPVVDEMPPAPARASADMPVGDFVAFFPKVPSALAAGPDLSKYGIECSVAIKGGGVFTLARSDDGKTALFVMTAQPVTDLAKVVSFGDPKKSQDWGFVYDRNGDGWVDYIAFLLGRMPVGTPEILAQVPKRPWPKAPGQFQVPRQEAELMQRSERLVFSHFADDDFDGKADAVVGALQDPDRWSWYHRRAALRGKNHTQVVGEDWTFIEDITRREGPVPRAPDGHLVPVEGLGKSMDDVLQRMSLLFELVNSGIRDCRVPKGALPRE